MVSFLNLLTGVVLLEGTSTPAPAPNILSYIPLVIDIIVVVFLVVSAILACKEGFLKGLVGFVGAIISIVIAFNFSALFATFLEEQFQLSTTLSGAVEGFLNSMEPFKATYSEENLLTALKSLALPEFITAPLIENMTGCVATEGTSVAQAVAPVLGGLIFTILSGIALFIISEIVILILEKILSAILDKIPVLGGINKVLGFLLGIVKALVSIYMILLVLSIIPIPVIKEFISQTVVLNWLSQNNVIVMILNQFNFQIPNFVGSGTTTAVINAIAGL